MLGRYLTPALSRALARDLQGLGYSTWVLYGTHSFRRGGCQYRIKVKRWSADMVAAWGGWSQVEAVTMFRYFYSPMIIMSTCMTTIEITRCRIMYSL
ncbi:hypothetical protein R3P38DRAFT_2518688 [Favolaschia claudopus]|uniref:Uncharacterized protein n=1 Tax=Favolaschia claudopus TaxID=2862362 RepID=A0AAW0C859_9AGAR